MGGVWGGLHQIGFSAVVNTRQDDSRTNLGYPGPFDLVGRTCGCEVHSEEHAKAGRSRQVGRRTGSGLARCGPVRAPIERRWSVRDEMDGYWRWFHLSACVNMLKMIGMIGDGRIRQREGCE